jgi:hypothetical protein
MVLAEMDPAGMVPAGVDPAETVLAAMGLDRVEVAQACRALPAVAREGLRAAEVELAREAGAWVVQAVQAADSELGVAVRLDSRAAGAETAAPAESAWLETAGRRAVAVSVEDLELAEEWEPVE